MRKQDFPRGKLTLVNNNENEGICARRKFKIEGRNKRIYNKGKTNKRIYNKGNK